MKGNWEIGKEPTAKQGDEAWRLQPRRPSLPSVWDTSCLTMFCLPQVKCKAWSTEFLLAPEPRTVPYFVIEIQLFVQKNEWGLRNLLELHAKMFEPLSRVERWHGIYFHEILKEIKDPNTGQKHSL